MFAGSCRAVKLSLLPLCWLRAVSEPFSWPLLTVSCGHLQLCVVRKGLSKVVIDAEAKKHLTSSLRNFCLCLQVPFGTFSRTTERCLAV